MNWGALWAGESALPTECHHLRSLAAEGSETEQVSLYPIHTTIPSGTQGSHCINQSSRTKMSLSSKNFQTISLQYNGLFWLCSFLTPNYMVVLCFPALAMLMNTHWANGTAINTPDPPPILFIDDNTWKTRVFSTLKTITF